MFKAIAKASAEIHAVTGGEPADIETITRIVTGVTPIDKVMFVEYESAPSNPVWGSFQKWTSRPTPYSPIETWVEIRYANHLDEAWRKFVVCKELCHALEEDDGYHAITPGAMDSLVNVFSLQSKKQPNSVETLPLSAEFLAEAGALELLCHHSVRREIAALELEDYGEHCAKYHIPDTYGWFAFGPKWIEAVVGFMRKG